VTGPTTTVTAPTNSLISLGSSNTDIATVTSNPGSGSPTGTVQFYDCAQGVSPCSSSTGTLFDTETLASSGANTSTATSAPTTPATPGTYCYAAVYVPASNSNYQASNDSTSDECFSVGKPAATVTTKPVSASIVLGQSNIDGATVQGVSAGGSPSGTVTFYVCPAPATSCTSATAGAQNLGAFPVTAGPADSSIAASPPFTPSTVGQWCFAGYYSGDSVYNAGSDGTTVPSDECFTVTAQPVQSFSTTPGATALNLGQSNGDSATVVGSAFGGAPQGTISFYLCGPPSTSCTPGGAAFDTETLVPGANNTSSVSSAPTTPSAPGTYCFGAVYNPSNSPTVYLSATDSAANECFTVTGPTTTVTAPLNATVTLGGTNADVATVTTSPAAGAPTGTVKFYECAVGTSPCTPSPATLFDTETLSASGANSATATSTAVTPAAPGTYCFAAVYVPTPGSFLGASNDSTSDECFTVPKPKGVLKTTPTAATIVLGSSDSDGASVQGTSAGGTPTGNVTFWACPAPATLCTATTPGAQDLGAFPLTAGPAGSDSASVVSPTFTPTSVGQWCFAGFYSGDSVYAASNDGTKAPSDECFTVGAQAVQSFSTTPSAASISLGQSATDSATVVGSNFGGAPAGTVSFYLCGPPSSSCTPAGTADTEALTQGAADTSTAHSAPVTPAAPGTYCFGAVYNPSNNPTVYLSATDSAANECFTVVGSTTTQSTVASGTIQLGQSNHDSIAVTSSANGGPPTGGVNFYLCGPGANSCSPAGTAVAATGPLGATGANSSGTTSANVTPDAVGTWCFAAVFQGSANYAASADETSGECFSVTAIPSQTTTTPSLASIRLGGTDSDQATVDGNGVGGPPAGEVTFYVCPPPATSCTPATAGAQDLGAFPVSQASTTTSSVNGPNFTPTSTGTWCFAGIYSPSNTPTVYLGSSDESIDECFLVTAAEATFTTKPANQTINLGQTNTDTATAVGNQTGGSPQGTVQFFECGPGAVSCPTTGVPFDTETLVAGANNTSSVSSAPIAPNAPGTWCYSALYSPTGAYATANDSTSDECFNVVGQTQTVTAPAAATISLGGFNQDIATVTSTPAGGSPTGSVSFYVCGPSANSCSPAGTPVATLTPLGASGTNSSSAVSAAFTPPTTGTWCFTAVYTATAPYAGSTDTTSDECFNVIPQNLVQTGSFSTTPAEASIALGQSNSDFATAVGSVFGGAPQGTVTFYACPPPATGCTSATTGATNLGAFPLNASGPPDTSVSQSGIFTPSTTGTWCFGAVYNPSDNPQVYDPATDSNANECFVVTGASTTQTTPSASTINLGGTNSDGVTVTGNPVGGAPSGNVEFFLCGPSVTSCPVSGTPFDTEALVAGTGDQSTVTSAAVPVNAAGIWCFSALYEGGTANGTTYTGSSDGATAPSDECFTVKGTATTKTTPAQASIVFGQSNIDNAVVTGVPSGGSPTGTVTFYSCGPDVTSCTTSGTNLGTFNLTPGTGDTSTVSSSVFTPTAVGTTGQWCFAAVYSGDVTYNGSNDGLSAPSDECFNVTAAPLAAFTTAPSGGTAGSPATDSATVVGTTLGGSPGGSVTFYICGPAAVTCSPGSGRLVGTVPVTPGAGNTSSATSGPVTPSAPGGYCWSAVYNPPAGSDYAAGTDTPECFQVGQVTLQKTASPSGTVSPGQQLTYTLTAVNSGGAASLPVTITDAVPAGTTFLSASCGSVSGCTANQNSGTVTFGLASVPGFSSESVSFIVTVNSGDTQAITNTAGFTGQNCISNCSSPPVTNQVADMTVTKSTSEPGGQINNGSTLTYTLTASSIGSVPGSAVITDSAPTGTTYVANSAMCPANSTAATCAVNVNGGTGVITWTLTNVPVGTTYNLTFQVVVNAAAATGTPISNTAFWTGNGCIPPVGMVSCPTNTTTTTVLDVIMTGEAYGLSASATALGIALVTIPPTPDTGPIATSQPSVNSAGCVASIMGIVNSSDVCASVTTSLGPATSTAVASTGGPLATVGLGAIPLIQANVIDTSSTTTCAGSVGTTSIAYLAVGSLVLINNPGGVMVTPNTVITVTSGVTITLNEQLPINSGGDHGLTVNGIDIEVNLPGILTASVITDSATSDIENCVS
jgi:uncharacterized repeat protein (TIGR01451 family)/fimbrial isopeptide formation D2 family protein